jgi:predicted metal-dependent peptidase
VTSEKDNLANVALDRAMHALRVASASLPHLSGLARIVRVKPTAAVSVAAVSSSGLLLIHPRVFADISLGDATFILAHELLHLALNTHGRQGEANPMLVNFAHDYIINDILRHELEREPPLGGLVMPFAREKSLEQLVGELQQEGNEHLKCWAPTGPTRSPLRNRAPRSAMTLALENAGLVPPQPEPPPALSEPRVGRGDLVSHELEAILEPEVNAALRSNLREQIVKAAAKAASLSEMRDAVKAAAQPFELQEPQRGSAMIDAVRQTYAPPWQLAMQRWFDSFAAGERTYARASRRGASHPEIIRPGRRREGWTLHVVLDTSGSMVDILPRALGAIATFCDASNVGQIHVVQCDEQLTGDVWVEPTQLERFEVAGFGYSDMKPAMLHLENDPDVDAVLLLTDGHIDFPEFEPAYRVVWGLIGEINQEFSPSYGQVIAIRSMCTFD